VPDSQLFVPDNQQFTLEQLITRVDRLQIKQEQDRQLTMQWIGRETENRKEIGAFGQEIAAFGRETAAIGKDIAAIGKDMAAVEKEITALKQKNAALKNEVMGLKALAMGRTPGGRMVSAEIGAAWYGK
jgi:predicted  nucleic acid-binding Zn-ribbon protein